MHHLLNIYTYMYYNVSVVSLFLGLQRDKKTHTVLILRSILVFHIKTLMSDDHRSNVRFTANGNDDAIRTVDTQYTMRKKT